jgi:anti-sigma-K factor RskA
MTDEPHSLAAEYVLGVLDEAERREAERRIAREPAFAAEVAYWEARLGTLAEDVAEVAPPARVWRGIEATIAGTPSRTRSVWNSLAFWRAFGVGSSGLPWLPSRHSSSSRRPRRNRCSRRWSRARRRPS